MAQRRSIVKPLLGLLGLLVLFAGAGLWWSMRASLPDDVARVRLDGLGAPVTVRYDHRRRPFVEAGSLADALLAQGWLHGRERLWQMELFRRAGSGSMAQGLGADLLGTDEELWRAGVPQLAASLARNASSELRTRLDAYVAGVNAAMSQYAVWPPEFLLTSLEPRPWTVDDVFAVGALVAFQSGNNMNNELLRLALAGVLAPERMAAFMPDEASLPDFPYVLDANVPNLLSSLDTPLLPSAALGSNGWVVAPNRSASGRALFAFDSHDDLAAPNLFYEVHLFFPPDRQIRGWSVAGLPGVINGYNRFVAWGLTNIGDTQDVFVERRDPEDPMRFLGPDGWYRATESEVAISIAGRSAPHLLKIVHTRHGPLIHDDPPLALRWTGHHIGALGLDGFFDINLADSQQALTDAFDRVPVPSANVTYADVAGNIGFRTIGLLPERLSGQGLVPADGARADSGWSGFVPPAKLPRAINPASGYLAAANARVAREPPLVSADNAPGYRMRRLRQQLGGTARLTLDDMQGLQLDWYNSQAALLLPTVLEALRASTWADSEQEALRLLEAWAGEPVNAPDAAGPVIWEHLYVALADELFAGPLTVALHERLKRNNYVLNHALDRILLDARSPWWDGDRRQRVGRAFSRAVAAAGERLDKDPHAWRWDALQHVAIRHELGSVPLVGRLFNAGPFPWGGGPATLGRARFRYAVPFEVRAAATVRVVAELHDGIHARAIMPGGQSGHPLAEHYADQIPAWLRGELDVIPADPRNLAPAHVLEPAGTGSPAAAR